MELWIDPGQDGMFGCAGSVGGVGFRIVSVVILPRCAEHLCAKGVPLLRPRIVAGVVEGVGGGSKGDQRFSARDVGVDQVELVLGQLPEADVEDREVGLSQRFQALDRVAFSAVELFIDEDGGLHPILAGENLREGRHRPLRTVLPFPDHEDHLGAIAVDLGKPGRTPRKEARHQQPASEAHRSAPRGPELDHRCCIVTDTGSCCPFAGNGNVKTTPTGVGAG